MRARMLLEALLTVEMQLCMSLDSPASSQQLDSFPVCRGCMTLHYRLLAAVRVPPRQAGYG